MSVDSFEKWDPMLEDYSDRYFNSYVSNLVPRNQRNNSEGFRMKQGNPESNEMSNGLYLKNIPTDLDMDTVRSIFSKYGPIQKIFVQQQQKGTYTYGFVYYSSYEEAQNAMLNFGEINNFGIYVEFARKNHKEYIRNREQNEDFRSSIMYDSHDEMDQEQPHSLGFPNASQTSMKGSGSLLKGAGRGAALDKLKNSFKVVCSGRGREVSMKPLPTPQGYQREVVPPAQNQHMSSYSENHVDHSKENIAYSQNHIDQPRGNMSYNENHIDHPRGNMSYNENHVDHPRGNMSYSENHIDHPRGNMSYSENHVNHPRENAPYSENRVNHTREKAPYSENHVNHTRENAPYSENRVNHTRENVPYSENRVRYSRENSVCSDNHVGYSRENMLSPVGHSIHDHHCMSNRVQPCSRIPPPGPLPSSTCCVSSRTETNTHCLMEVHRHVTCENRCCYYETIPCRNQLVNNSRAAPYVIRQTGPGQIHMDPNSDPVSNIPDLQPNLALCGNCGVIGNQACVTCKQAYCSRKCQITDWPRHKVICKTNSYPTQHSPKNVDQQQIIHDNEVKNYKSNTCASGKNSSDSHEDESVLMKNVEKFDQKDNKYIKKQPTRENMHSKKSKKIRAEEIKATTLSVTDNERVQVCDPFSPDEFFVQRFRDRKILEEIEVQMTTLSKNRTILDSPCIGDLCGSLFVDKKLYRAKVTGVNSDNTCQVFYIDYGNAGVTNNSDLCYLTDKLATYPAQAVCCKLVDIKPPNNCKQWGQKEMESFALTTDKIIMKATVIRTYLSKCEVDLVKSDGVSISSILVNGKNAAWISADREDPFKIELNNESSLFDVPTMLKKLKVAMAVSIGFVGEQKLGFWGWLDCQNAVEMYMEYENQIQSQAPDTNNITMLAEEGEFVIAFSTSYNMWFRSYILKRMKNSFIVRYIDYGNEEEVTKLCTLTPEGLKVCSPLMFFEVPTGSNKDILQKLFLNEASAVVQEVSQHSVKILCSLGNKSLCLNGFSWYHGLSSDEPQLPKEKESQSCNTVVKQADSTKPKSAETAVGFTKQFSPQKEVTMGFKKEFSPEIKEKIVQKNSPRQRLDISIINKTHCSATPEPISPVLDKLQVAKNILVQRELSTTCRTKINVLWINTQKSEFYVQKTSDTNDLYTLLSRLNSYCSKQENYQYTPVEGEVVCSKFSYDGKWYRGLILKICPDNEFDIFFIDFGNIDRVPVENVQPLSKEFYCPPFCICVSVSGITTEIENQEFKRLITESDWDLEVVDSKTTPTEVMLFKGEKQLLEYMPSDKKDTKCNKSNTVAEMHGKITEEQGPELNANSIMKKTSLLTKISEFDNAEVQLVYGNELEYLYVQLVSDKIIFDSMQQKLNSVMAKIPHVKYTPVIDDVVCALFDNVWYRGYVKLVDGSKCFIKFFDNGETNEIAFENIRQMPEEFSLLPVFSLNVALDGVSADVLAEDVINYLKKMPYMLKFVDKTSQPIKVKFFWGENCINDVFEPGTNISEPEIKVVERKVKKISCMEKQILPVNQCVEAIFVYQEDDKFFLTQVNDLECTTKILELLQAEQCTKPLDGIPEVGEVLCAKCSDGMWYRACVEEILSADSFKVLFIDFGNTEKLSQEDLCTLSDELSSFPIFCTCVTVSEMNALPQPIEIGPPYSIQVVGNPADEVVKIQIVTESDNEVASLPAVSVSDSQNVPKTEEPPSIAAPVPASVKMEPKYILNYDNCIDFPLGEMSIMVYSVTNTDALFCAPNVEQNIVVNCQLLSEITEFCNQLPDQRYKPLDIHEMVLARYPEDQCWYRAAVVQINETDYTVYFIDYGGFESLTEESLREMNEKFMALPYQAHICKLGGISFTEENSVKVNELLKSILPPFTPVDAVVTKEDETIIVDIPIVKEQLVQEGVVTTN